MFEINLTSQLLQSKEFDLNAATNALLKTKTFLESCRSDLGYEKMLVEAREISEEANIPASFASESKPVRLRKKDEPVHDKKDKFKINFYFTVLDNAINSIDERFTQIKNVNYVFGCLDNIHEMQNKTSKAVLKDCIKLEKSFSHADSKGVDAAELCGELQAIA